MVSCRANTKTAAVALLENSGTGWSLSPRSYLLSKFHLCIWTASCSVKYTSPEAKHQLDPIFSIIFLKYSRQKVIMHSYYAHDSNYLIMSSAVSFCSIRPIEKYSHTAKHWCFHLKATTNEIKDTFWFYMKFKILWKLYMKIYILKYIWKLPTIWDKEEQPQSCVKSQSLIWPSFTGSNTCGPWCCRANYRAELFSHICWLSNSDSLLLTKLNRVAFLLYRDLQMWVWKRGSALRESRKKVIIKAVFLNILYQNIYL